MNTLFIEISDIDAVTAHDCHQGYMRILKERGAPIVGTFWLTVETGWTVIRTDEPGKVSFRFLKESEG